MPYSLRCYLTLELNSNKNKHCVILIVCYLRLILAYSLHLNKRKTHFLLDTIPKLISINHLFIDLYYAYSSVTHTLQKNI